MKKTFLTLTVLLIMAACQFPGRGPQMITIRGVVFGTYYSIIYYDEEARVLQEEIDSIFQDFNSSMSFYDPQSILSQVNRNDPVLVDEYFKTVFNRSKEISMETDGAFDATVFPLVNAWGFGVDQRASMTEEIVDSLMQFVGFEKIDLVDGRIVKYDERVQLDFNAIAKGYAADVIGHYLESIGVTAYMVEIGGDLIARGSKPDGSKWRIGLEIPAKDHDAQQEWHYFVEVYNQGLATSGDYRRYIKDDGKRYSHTIDPQTGYPVTHNLMSASVFAGDAMSADAYATAFMVMGLDKSIAFVEARDDLEAYFIFSDDSNGYGYYASSGLQLLSRDDL